jgi:cell wall-associated NlpC family hydrolase
VTALKSAQDLASTALDLIGIRYKWGGNTPETGLDCSGLVRYVFQHVTGVTLPRTAKDISRLGTEVAVTDLQPGDLVFFNTRRFAFSHVGIYLGDNQFIHAPRRGREVEVATLDSGFWKRRFDGARRMAGVLPSLLPALVGEAAAAPLALPEADEIPTDR